MPMGAPSQVPEPKSRYSPLSAPMLAIRLAELGSTSAPLMSVFQGMSPLSEAPTPKLALDRLPWVPPRRRSGSCPVAASGVSPPPPPPQALNRQAGMATRAHRRVGCIAPPVMPPTRLAFIAGQPVGLLERIVAAGGPRHTRRQQPETSVTSGHAHHHPAQHLPVQQLLRCRNRFGEGDVTGDQAQLGQVEVGGESAPGFDAEAIPAAQQL